MRPMNLNCVGVFCVRLTLASLLSLTGCEKTIQDPLPAAVHVTSLTEEEIPAALRFTATVREHQRVTLSFKVNGLIQDVLQVPDVDGTSRDVQEGDLLDEGSVLGQLDDSDYRRQQQVAFERVEQAKARLMSARATAENAQIDGDRKERLVAQQAVSKGDWDAAQARMKTTIADVAAAQKELALAELDVHESTDRLENCSLQVPFANATVAARYIERNERIAANAAAFVVLDLTRLVATFGVPDHMVSQLKLSQSLRVNCEVLPECRLLGTISKIAPVADDRTRTFPIEVTIECPQMLRPGMSVSIEIGEPRLAQLVPVDAIQSDGTSQQVVIYQVVQVEGNTLVRRRNVAIQGVLGDRLVLRAGPETQIVQVDLIVVVGEILLNDCKSVRVL